jgi:hypothetical protein
MPQKLTATRTSVTLPDMLEALRRVWEGGVGTQPRHTNVVVLLSQFALETGRGKKMWNYNVGNAKARAGGATDWTFFECDEILPHARAKAYAATGGALVVVKPFDAKNSRVIFKPEHDVCRFRAFPTLDAGLADHFTMLRSTFKTAWTAVERGDPLLYGRLLRKGGYYTAPEAQYTTTLGRLFLEFWPLSHAEALDVRRDASMQRALLTLGYDIGPRGVDGNIGPRTRLAIRKFQKDRDLGVDGVAGLQTRVALILALEAFFANAPAGAEHGLLLGGPKGAWRAGPTIAPRSADALTGSQFLKSTAKLSAPAREEAICAELLAGNVPSFYRSFKPLSLSEGAVSVTVDVAPDYLAIGSDADFVRMPMSPLTAQKVADAFGCSLPTRKLVDRIYKAAEIKLEPVPLPPTSRMMSNEYYARHQKRIEAMMPSRAQGRLVAGHKKDVVLSNALLNHPGKVAIYGWHRKNGRPIQALNATSHENTYADYSHGIRLVSLAASVNGAPRNLGELLQSPELSAPLSDEGPLKLTRVPHS